MFELFEFKDRCSMGIPILTLISETFNRFGIWN